MKIFTTSQIADVDRYTIEHEPVSESDLMERASLQVVTWLIRHIPAEKNLIFFAGPGNNGGDALAIARLMANRSYQCEVFLLDFGREMKGASLVNLNRLKEQGKVTLKRISSEADLPVISSGTVIVDGLFGSGLSRKLEGLSEKVTGFINDSGALVVSIDIPSGLFGEDNSNNDLSKVVKADHTLTFQFPKLSFLFPEHEDLLGKWEVLPIGLHPEAISSFPTSFNLLDHEWIAPKVLTRKKFSHKGTFGHALLIAGSCGKIGAAVLASRACLRGGTGLLTVHLPNPAVPIMQVAVPEAICSADPSDLMFTEFPDLTQFSAIGIGPGIGIKPNTRRALKELLQTNPSRIVLDADALNILSRQQEWFDYLPENAILTPHPKEFERMVGPAGDSWTRLQQQIEFSGKYKVIVVLKGAHTSISFPDGEVWFNTTGNPGMATAGSGDVLTGLMLSLLAQPYPHKDVAMLAVYLHGLAGDLAASQIGQEALIAGDLPDHFGKAFMTFRQ